MKKSELIYELIDSLDKSEKRSFQIYLNKYHKASNAQVLFETISKLKIKDKKSKTDEQLKDLGIKNLAYEKHRLKGLLIEFLGDHYKYNSPFRKLHALSIQISVLMDKGQYGIVADLIEEGRTLAKKVGAYNFLFEFDLDRIKLAKKQFNLSRSEFHALLEEPSDNLNKLTKELEYKKLQEKMYFWFLFNLNEDPKIAQANTEKIISNDLLEDESNAVSINEKKYLLRTKMLYYRATENWEELVNYQDQLNLLYEKNKEYTQHHFSEYISNFYNSVGSYLLAGKNKEAVKILKKGDKFPEKYKDLFDKRIAETYYSFALMGNLSYLSHLGKFKEMRTYIKAHKEEVDYYLSKSPTFKADYYCFGMGQAFALENYKECKEWCRTYEKDIDINEKRQPSYWYVKMFSIIAHYELEEKEKLSSQINAYYYHQRKHKVDDIFYKGVMKLFRKLQVWPSPEELSLACEQLKTLIEENALDSYKGKVNLVEWLAKKIIKTKGRKVKKA